MITTRELVESKILVDIKAKKTALSDRCFGLCISVF